MADRLVITFGPERTYEPVGRIHVSPFSQRRTSWPEDIRRCSECRSLMLATDTEGHEDWHRKLASTR